jgi:hypothetical protein
VNAPAVGAFNLYDCMGVLVGRRTVLTTASCFVDTGRFPPREVVFADATGRKWRVASGTLHPGYRLDAAGGRVHDLAVVTLAAAPGIRPFALGKSGPTVGRSLTLIGYAGLAESDRRGQAPIQVQAAAGGRFTGMQNAANSASRFERGASVLDRGVLVALLSDDNHRAVATGVRLSAYATWITQVTGGDVVLATR